MPGSNENGSFMVSNATSQTASLRAASPVETPSDSRRERAYRAPETWGSAGLEDYWAGSLGNLDGASRQGGDAPRTTDLGIHRMDGGQGLHSGRFEA
jgi:hypothetical protein